MAYCLYCGSSIADEAQFCETCGRRQVGVRIAQPGVQAGKPIQDKAIVGIVVLIICAVLLFILLNVIPSLLIVGLLFTWLVIFPGFRISRNQKLTWSLATLALAIGIQAYQAISNERSSTAESHSPSSVFSDSANVAEAGLNDDGLGAAIGVCKARALRKQTALSTWVLKSQSRANPRTKQDTLDLTNLNAFHVQVVWTPFAADAQTPLFVAECRVLRRGSQFSLASFKSYCEPRDCTF